MVKCLDPACLSDLSRRRPASSGEGPDERGTGARAPKKTRDCMLLQNTVHIHVRIRTFSKYMYNQQSIPFNNKQKNQNLSCERQGGEALQKQSTKFDIFFGYETIHYRIKKCVGRLHTFSCVREGDHLRVKDASGNNHRLFIDIEDGPP